HRVHGVSIPRDAGPQSTSGTGVSLTALRPGDLLFYTRNGEVHHVTMSVGRGRMIHAPSTGHVVETISVATAPFASEFSGARRFVG
ncbi:MAG TPA: NlpC/P60 family protein, partial [Phycicoccus sp.]